MYHTKHRTDSPDNALSGQSPTVNGDSWLSCTVVSCAVQRRYNERTVAGCNTSRQSTHSTADKHCSWIYTTSTKTL